MDCQTFISAPSERELVDKILKSDPAQSVLDMGYQPNMIKKAIQFILKRDGKVFVICVTCSLNLLFPRLTKFGRGYSNRTYSNRTVRHGKV